MLGRCPSGEKIDLTRFWNWQDSPADTAPAIAPVTLPSSQVATLSNAQVGTQLGSLLPNLVNNNTVVPAGAAAATGANGALAQALISAMASAKGIDPSLNTADKLAALVQSTQTTADSARSDMVKANTQVTQQALSTLGSILTAPSGSSGGASKASGDKKSGSDSSGGGSGGGSVAGSIVTDLLPLIIAAFA